MVERKNTHRHHQTEERTVFVVDEVARELLAQHMKTCTEGNAELKVSIDNLWKAVDKLRKLWLSAAGGLIVILLGVIGVLLKMVWKAQEATQIISWP